MIDTISSTMMGKVVYSNPKEVVSVSLPHILNINDTLPGRETIFLLDANTNYQVGPAGNFGNKGGITVTYTSTNPLVPFTYGSFLGTLLTDPFVIGLIRVQASTPSQLQQPLNLIYNPGVGKFWGDGIYPVIYPNQYISNVAYVEGIYSMNDNLGLTYIQNGSTDKDVQIYFYTTANVVLDRAFSNKKIVQHYSRPQTDIMQQTQIISASGKYGMLLKSSNLL